jgi:hypothetical protein
LPAPDPIITVLREWLAEADQDLLSAADLLSLGADCPTDTAGFHAQQGTGWPAAGAYPLRPPTGYNDP